MLSLTTKFGGLVAATALALGLAGAASAATLSLTGPLPATSLMNPIATDSAGVVVENSSVDTNDRKGPWLGLGTSNVYSSAGSSTQFSFLEYTFANLKDKLSFVWGTPDTFNKVTFLLGGVEVDSVLGFGNGANIATPVAMISGIKGGVFDGVRFSSEKRSFEFASVTATSVAEVPVPAAGLLLLTAVGAVAALRRRKSA